MNAEYIRGFFDRLCSVDLEGRAIVLTTEQTDLACQVAVHLRQMGIGCSISWSARDRVKLRVSGRTSLSRWSSEIGFAAEDKKERLARVLTSYRRQENVEPVVGAAEGSDQAPSQGVPGIKGRED